MKTKIFMLLSAAVIVPGLAFAAAPVTPVADTGTAAAGTEKAGEKHEERMEEKREERREHRRHVRHRHHRRARHEEHHEDAAAPAPAK